MPRYWVNLGIWDFGISGYPEDDEVEKQLLALDSRIQYFKNGGLVFKTEDLKEARIIASKGMGIIKKYLQEKEHAPPAEHMAELKVTITTQPQCPKCKNYGRFSDEYCGRCGTKLTEKECVDFEDVEPETVKFT